MLPSDDAGVIVGGVGLDWEGEVEQEEERQREAKAGLRRECSVGCDFDGIAALLHDRGRVGMERRGRVRHVAQRVCCSKWDMLGGRDGDAGGCLTPVCLLATTICT